MFAERTSRTLSCLGSPDVGHLDVEVEGLSRQRVVEVDHDSLLFDFMDAHGDRFPLRAFGCSIVPTFCAWAGACLEESPEGSLSNHIRRAPTYQLLLGVDAISGGLGIAARDSPVH